MRQVEDLSTPDRPAVRQAIIAARLAEPLEAVSRDDFEAMLRRYNPNLYGRPVHIAWMVEAAAELEHMLAYLGLSGAGNMFYSAVTA